MTEILNVHQLSGGYGDFQALFGIDISISEGETIAIIGANGAGKSTMLRAIMGQVKVLSGSITFDGEDLAGVPTHGRVDRGLALVPEGRKIFPSLTVEENLLIGGHLGRKGPWNLKSVVKTLPLLERLLKQSGAKLSGGEQQTIAIGRALMSNPRLILLDEVSLGLAPTVVQQVYSALPDITGAGSTAVVVEQDILQALAVSSRVYCMLEGRISLTGTPDSLAKDQITNAYFGISK